MSNRMTIHEYVARCRERGEFAEARQCRALSLLHFDANCCVLLQGHDGAHVNTFGTAFSHRQAVERAADLPDNWSRRCPRHPRYQVRRPPRSTCECCWRLYCRRFR